MRTHVALALLIAAAVAAPVAAGPLAPAKPSQVLTLMRDATAPNAPCGATSGLINAMISPVDGSLSPFTIPAGQVFVLTGGSWSDPLSSGASAHLRIMLRTSTTANTLFSSPSVLAGSAGHAAGSFVVEPGIVVKPGAALCTELVANGTAVSNFPRLYGYLTKDK